MCRLHTEGTQHGCGHYIITRKVAKEDCKSPYCIYSSAHKDDCVSCPVCTRYLNPDATETITRSTPDYCPQCEYWYKGPGARRR